MRRLEARSRRRRILERNLRHLNISTNVGAAVEPCCVPLIGMPEGNKYLGFGSGVLVALSGQPFIFTAGHVVRAIERRTVGMALDATPRPFVPGYLAYLYDHDHDAGVLPLKIADAQTIRLAGKQFMSETGILPRDGTRMLRELRRDWMCVTGFPAERAQVTDAGVGLEYVAASFQLRDGTTNVDIVDDLMIDGLKFGRTFRLAANPKKIVDATRPGFPSATLPKLRGMSGGGAWKVCTAQDGDAMLIGTHSASKVELDEVEIWETPVSAHLRLVARDSNFFRQALARRWPHVFS